MGVKFLSHLIDQNTPSYGNRNPFICEPKRRIEKGDRANDSFLHLSAHLGTHLDFPLHFYSEGQSIEDFSDDFWLFTKPEIIEIEPENLIIEQEIINKFSKISKQVDCLIIKTGICHRRESQDFWENNYGFSPKLAGLLRENFKKLKIFGFDSISLSSFKHRDIGFDAHRAFLDPEKPILILEDMDLRDVHESEIFEKLIIAPLRISRCDGVPVTVIGLTA